MAARRRWTRSSAMGSPPENAVLGFYGHFDDESIGPGLLELESKGDEWVCLILWPARRNVTATISGRPALLAPPSLSRAQRAARVAGAYLADRCVARSRQ